MSRFEKGSEWRIWDLHIHTPGTNKNDQFEGSSIEEKWKKYAEDINKSVNSISVIGITDYFSISNYLKFKEKIKIGEITKPFEMVIPNIELRITPVTGSNKPINIHCLFNPEIDDEIENRFLGKLNFTYNERNYNASKSDLIAFGKKFEGNENLDDNTAYKKGVDKYVISFESLCSLFKEDKNLRENTIVIVANSGNDGVSGLRNHKDFFESTNTSLSQLDAIVNSIYQFSDAVFSSNPKDRDFFIGLGSESEKNIIGRFKNLMPCYHGCDAHDNKKIFNPDKNRFCWIKADPTFIGLKQTLYEPKERVIIQELHPDSKLGYHVISKILVEHNLIQNEEIFLNSGLNCIIGGRSTGKSILLSTLAKKLKTKEKAKDNNPKYDELINGISGKIRVIWKDEKENNEREIEFFHQGYMNQYSNDADKFDGLIKAILKEKANGNLFEEYDNFVGQNKSVIQNEINKLFNTLAKIEERKENIVSIGDLEGISEEIKKLNISIEDYKLKNKFLSENDDQFKKLNNSLAQTLISIKTTRESKINLDSIRTEHEIKNKKIQGSFSEELKPKLEKLYDSLVKIFNDNWNEGLKDITKDLEKAIQKFEIEVESIQNNPIYTYGLEFLENNQNLKEFTDRLNKEVEKKRLIENLKKEILELESEFEKMKISIIDNHRNYYLRASEISEKLSVPSGDLEIKAYPKFLKDDYNNLLSGAINLKSEERKNLAAFNLKEAGEYEFYEKEIKEKFQLLLEDKIQLKGNYNSKHLLERIFQESYFKISYEVTYENDKYDEMSEGKQAFVVLKLLLDFSDKKCPILIDQPEDDLDNRAIYDDLVKYLRYKKAERQIIIVTHNPNIVIGTDAELVIVANQHGIKNQNTDSKKFQYCSGSIENTFTTRNENVVLAKQGIREHICEILEGGKLAFKLREKRYDIK